MEKKTTKRQTTIITLSDHNKQEIRNIQLQKEIMEEEFNDKERGWNQFYNYFIYFCGSMSSQNLINYSIASLHLH